MRNPPPPQLVALLERLGLATEAQVARVAGRVRRLAGELPRFESVWVDALAQARMLTPFQAAEINAGRGERLRIGRFVLCERLAWPHYVPCYRARQAGPGRKPGDSVSVTCIAHPRAYARGSPVDATRFQTLATLAETTRSEHIAPITEASEDGDRIWAVAPWVEGRSAAEWMVHNGRFPAEVALEIARQMAAALVALEQAGLCHGDPSAAGLTLTEGGRVVLLLPGVRAIVRPAEGYAHADLPPEAFDYLAPERVAAGTLPNVASDMYACGCLWWHLLCGRPPLVGGDSLAKLRAAQAGDIRDLRRFAPEVHGPLEAAIAACLQREPKRRPESMARLAATLGPSTRSGRIALERCLANEGRAQTRLAMRPAFASRGYGRIRVSRHWWAAGVACAAVGLAAVLWPVWFAWRAPGVSPGIADRSNQLHPRADARGSPMQGAVRVGQTGLAAAPVPGPPKDLVLPADKPIDGWSLKIVAGQRIRGAMGNRPLVLAPPAGLVVSVEGVRFENVDFVWQPAGDAEKAVDPPPAIIQLRAAKTEFHGCRFQAAPGTAALPAAIVWTHPADPQSAAMTLPSGRVQLNDCVLERVAAGLDCRTAGALSVELGNTLFLGSGPLVRLDHCPGGDEPVLLNVARVTLRGSGPLLECRYQRSEAQPGDIAIQATASVFAPAAGVPLIRFNGDCPDFRGQDAQHGRENGTVPFSAERGQAVRTASAEMPVSVVPEQLLQNLRWTGQGSLVTPATAIAAWQVPHQGPKTLDDAAVSIAGLVRSEVGFAGAAQTGPSASRAQRWQAPLQSADPPGIDPKSLARETPGPARPGSE